MEALSHLTGNLRGGGESTYNTSIKGRSWRSISGLPKLFELHDNQLHLIDMMLTELLGLASAAALASSAAYAAPVLEPRATTPCYTTHTGRVLYAPNDPYGLNSANQMIYPSTGTALTVLLQVSTIDPYASLETLGSDRTVLLLLRRVPMRHTPPIIQTTRVTEVRAIFSVISPSEGSTVCFFHLARLVAVEGGSIGANQCLTTLQSPSDSNIFYMHLASCRSNTNPPTSQAFVLDTNDFGHEIWHVRIFTFQPSPSHSRFSLLRVVHLSNVSLRSASLTSDRE